MEIATKTIAKARIRFYEDEYGEECDEILVTYSGETEEKSFGKFISYGIHKRFFNSEKMIGLTEMEAHDYVDSLFEPYLSPWTKRTRG